jgi:hypothetical protein
MSKVSLLRLINGELIVGKVTEDGDNLVIEKPYQFGLFDQGQIGLIDFFQLFKSDSLTVPKSGVLYQDEVSDHVYALYTKESSGIQVPQSSGPELDISDLTS